MFLMEMNEAFACRDIFHVMMTLPIWCFGEVSCPSFSVL